MGSPAIDILLATFNGERFLAGQIDSVLAQTGASWRLIIRDDCSDDTTPLIIERYCLAFPDRITVLDNNGERLGSCGNFGRLLASSTAPYVMFCDQDDVWLPGKILATMQKMEEMEQTFGTGMPILVHTDMSVVDVAMEPICESFWKYQNLDLQNGLTLNRLLLRNVPTGSTIMLNKALRAISPDVPGGAVVHDWWLALVAAAFGRIGSVTTPTLLYRQHDENVFGAARWSAARMIRDFCTPAVRRETAKRRAALIARQEKQAKTFLDCYGKRLSAGEAATVKAFSTLSSQGAFVRRLTTIRYGFWYSNLLENLGMFFFR